MDTLRSTVPLTRTSNPRNNPPRPADVLAHPRELLPNVPNVQKALFQQNTIARATSVEGLGIHTGRPVTLRLLPAPVDTGIIFRRTDRGNVEIPARCSEVVSLDLATTLGTRQDPANEGGASEGRASSVTVSTIEHLMAAAHMMSIDNLIVEVNGPEIPILDGSATPFMKLLEAAGVEGLAATRKVFVVTEPVELELEDKWIRVSPYPGLRISYTLDYEIESIGHQEIDFVIDRTSFGTELASARTFGLRRDIDRLHAMGLGLGGRKDNCVVFSADGPTNTALRFPDEPVRHKALDAIGDFALLGAPLWGHLEVKRGGHLLHYRLMEKLLANPHTWSLASLDASHQIEGQDGLPQAARATG